MRSYQNMFNLFFDPLHLYLNLPTPFFNNLLSHLIATSELINLLF